MSTLDEKPPPKANEKQATAATALATVMVVASWVKATTERALSVGERIAVATERIAKVAESAQDQKSGQLKVDAVTSKSVR